MDQWVDELSEGLSSLLCSQEPFYPFDRMPAKRALRAPNGGLPQRPPLPRCAPEPIVPANSRSTRLSGSVGLGHSQSRGWATDKVVFKANPPPPVAGEPFVTQFSKQGSRVRSVVLAKTLMKPQYDSPHNFVQKNTPQLSHRQNLDLNSHAIPPTNFPLPMSPLCTLDPAAEADKVYVIGGCARPRGCRRA